MNTDIREQLIQLAEPEYQAFTSKLLPGTTNILGVRLPLLRKIAKQLVKEDWRSYLLEASEAYFEEVMLQGMVIGYVKADMAEIVPYITDFIPKIDNWSVCDSFCSGLKLSKKYPKEMWKFIQPYLKDSREYYIRFGVVMLLNYYISEEYIKEALQAMEEIKNDDYYVKMGVAWAVSMYYIKLPTQTMPFLINNQLDDFTYNKALQKIVESQKIDNETKTIIRALKRQRNMR
jgi:3-methyladenine DNA glycosylase AlkD